MKKVKLFLDYAETHPDAIVTFRASDMILAVHSDASYLSETKSHRRARGHSFMSDNAENPANNWDVLTMA